MNRYGGRGWDIQLNSHRSWGHKSDSGPWCFRMSAQLSVLQRGLHSAHQVIARCALPQEAGSGEGQSSGQRPLGVLVTISA